MGLLSLRVMAITRLLRLLRFEVWLVITLSMSAASLATTDSMSTSAFSDTMMSTTLPSQSTVINDFESTSSIPFTTFQTDANQSQSLGASDGVGRDGKIPIYLGGFFTLGGNWDGSGILPVVEMALEHVNNRPDLLADYELRMVWNDTQVRHSFFLFGKTFKFAILKTKLIDLFSNRFQYMHVSLQTPG